MRIEAIKCQPVVVRGGNEIQEAQLLKSLARIIVV